MSRGAGKLLSISVFRLCSYSIPVSRLNKKGYPIGYPFLFNHMTHTANSGERRSIYSVETCIASLLFDSPSSCLKVQSSPLRDRPRKTEGLRSTTVGAKRTSPRRSAPPDLVRRLLTLSLGSPLSCTLQVLEFFSVHVQCVYFHGCSNHYLGYKYKFSTLESPEKYHQLFHKFVR